jgi:microcystin-dependent protein
MLSGKADDPHDHNDTYYTESEVDALLAGIDVAIVGEVRMFARLSLPSGWLPCDGTSYLQTAYPDLFGAIGVYYGGSATHFNVPDFRGRFALSQGNGYIFAQDGGEEEHTLVSSEMPIHNHPENEWTSGNEVSGYGLTVTSSFQDRVLVNAVSGDVTGNRGGGNPHNNMPPYLVLGFAIYAG